MLQPDYSCSIDWQHHIKFLRFSAIEIARKTISELIEKSALLLLPFTEKVYTAQYAAHIADENKPI